MKRYVMSVEPWSWASDEKKNDDFRSVLVESPDGDLVRFEDVERMTATIASLREDVAKALEYHRATVGQGAGYPLDGASYGTLLELKRRLRDAMGVDVMTGGIHEQQRS